MSSRGAATKGQLLPESGRRLPALTVTLLGATFLVGAIVGLIYMILFLRGVPEAIRSWIAIAAAGGFLGGVAIPLGLAILFWRLGIAIRRGSRGAARVAMILAMIFTIGSLIGIFGMIADLMESMWSKEDTVLMPLFAVLFLLNATSSITLRRALRGDGANLLT